MHDKNTGPLKLEPGKNCECFAMIGSQVIPGAAHEGSDTDIAILLIEGADPDEMFGQIILAAEMHVQGNDCEISDSGGEYDSDGMTSCKVWRGPREAWNYLVFTDKEYFDKFVDCTTLAIRFGIVDKPLRVELFQLICDGLRRSTESHFNHVEIIRSEEVPF